MKKYFHNTNQSETHWIITILYFYCQNFNKCYTIYWFHILYKEIVYMMEGEYSISSLFYTYLRPSLYFLKIFQKLTVFQLNDAYLVKNTCERSAECGDLVQTGVSPSRSMRSPRLLPYAFFTTLPQCFFTTVRSKYYPQVWRTFHYAYGD